MTENKGHYPHFDVMHEDQHWDEHTRHIVHQRLHETSMVSFQVLTQQEANTLFHLCSLLLDDPRGEVMVYVVHHFDALLKSDIGESQRKVGVPAQSALIRNGLALLDQTCVRQYGDSLDKLTEDTKKEVVSALMQGTFRFLPWDSPDDQDLSMQVAVDDLMQKILTETIASYYSHPFIWSEIGYAGPAYPRGYVRSELGLTDPWEARQNDY